MANTSLQLNDKWFKAIQGGCLLTLSCETIPRPCTFERGYVYGRGSFKEKPLIQPQKIYMLPFLIMLGLMKNFVQSIGKKNSVGFKYLQKRFPNVSDI